MAYQGKYCQIQVVISFSEKFEKFCKMFNIECAAPSKQWSVGSVYQTYNMYNEKNAMILNKISI